MIEVLLQHYTPLWVTSYAIRKCYDSHDKSDTIEKLQCNICSSEDISEYIDDNTLNNSPITSRGNTYHICNTCGSNQVVSKLVCGENDKELIERVGNKFKHESVKNHITYNFVFNNITTKTLLALTRHDIGVEFSVQSTRYTTKKCVRKGSASFTESKNELVTKYLYDIMEMVKDCVDKNIDNDEISLLLPQAWRYNLVCSMSMSAVQHFLNLRLAKEAHWDIRDLANKIYESLPKEHLFLFTECKGENK